jgi:alpha-tubulin suppressor-like RCC1 family protein
VTVWWNNPEEAASLASLGTTSMYQSDTQDPVFDSSVVVPSSTYSFRYANSDYSAYWHGRDFAITGGQSEYYLETYFRTNLLLDYVYGMLTISDTTWPAALRLYMPTTNFNYPLGAGRFSYDSDIFTSSFYWHRVNETNVYPDTWYKITIRIVANGNSGDYIRIYINDVLEIERSGASVDSTTFDFLSIAHQNFETTPVQNVWYDGLYLASEASNGSVWAWGDNDYGQMSDGTYNERQTPFNLTAPTSVSTVCGGWKAAYALLADGTVRAWGANDKGQLGNGTTTPSTPPVQCVGLTDIIAISAGQGHVIALKADGTVWTWGDDEFGQLGDNLSGYGAYNHTPTQVLGVGGVGTLSGITRISAGASHCHALANDGTLYGWGINNPYPCIGDNSTTDRHTPVVVGITDVVELSGGGAHTLALKSDGTVWAWGWNLYGQLATESNSPTTEKAPIQCHISGVTTISASALHSHFLKSDGTVWSSGFNWAGVIGDNTTTNRLAPTQVHGVGNVGYLEGITKIAACDSHMLALNGNGTVYAWGYNGTHGLGDGTITNRYTPTVVAGLPSTLAIGPVVGFYSIVVCSPAVPTRRPFVRFIRVGR